MSIVFAEAGVLKHLQQSSGVCHINIEPSLVEDFEFSPRYNYF